MQKRKEKKKKLREEKKETRFLKRRVEDVIPFFEKTPQMGDWRGVQQMQIRKHLQKKKQHGQKQLELIVRRELHRNFDGFLKKTAAKAHFLHKITKNTSHSKKEDVMKKMRLNGSQGVPCA